MSGSLCDWIRLTFLAPLITSTYNRLSRRKALWISWMLGLLVDLMTGCGRLGLVPLVYALSTLILYPLGRRMLRAGTITVPFLSALFGLLLTVLNAIITGKVYLLFSSKYAVTDLFLMPCLDGLFALLLIILPINALESYRKHRIYRLSRPQ